MVFIPFLTLLIAVFSNLSGQQLPSAKEEEKFVTMEIASAVAGKQFEFSLVRLSRSGKACDLRSLECKTPFRLSVLDESYLILYGKSGQGKIVMNYRMTGDRETSYQYLGEGEAIVIEFLPKLVGGGSTKWWTQGKATAPRLSVTVMSRDR